MDAGGRDSAVMTEREMGKKLYLMGRDGVSVNWKDNAFLKTAGRRVLDMAMELETLRKRRAAPPAGKEDPDDQN